MHDKLGPRGAVFEGVVQYSSESWRGEANARGFDLEQMDEFGVDAVVSAYIQRYHEELFFHKHDDWSAEHEYRWVLVEPDPLPVYVDIDGALTGVVLGASFPQERLQAVHELAARFGGVAVSQVGVQNGGIIRMPSNPPILSFRPRRRDGTVDERRDALSKADAAAATARTQAEASLAPLMNKLRMLVHQRTSEIGSRAGVNVGFVGRALAVPPADRARKPGVPTYESDLDCGAVFVFTNDSPPVEFVIGAALQALAGDRLRIHGVLSTRNIASSEPDTELWRFRRELDLDIAAAEQLLEAMAEEMSAQLPTALERFDDIRQDHDI